MLENLLLKRTENIRAEIASRKKEIEDAKKEEDNQVIELEALFERYSKEVEKTKIRISSESQDLSRRSDQYIKKVQPLLNVIENFIENHSLFPKKETYDFSRDSKYSYSFNKSQYFPIQFFDTGIEIPEIEEDIRNILEHYEVYDDYSERKRQPYHNEKVKELNRRVDNLQELHPLRKYGIRWGIDGYREERNLGVFGETSREHGVYIYSLDFTFMFLDQIKINKDDIDVSRLDEENYFEELLITNFVDKPECFGFLSTAELQSKEFTQENNSILDELDESDPFLKSAWKSLKNYAEYQSANGDSKDDKQDLTQWFDENLPVFSEHQAKKLLELAKSRGYEDHIFKLINRLPIRNYFSVAKIFAPDVDHLQKAIDSYLRGINYGLEKTELLGYFYKVDTLDRQFLATIGNQLKGLGNIMLLLHEKGKLTVDFYCEIFDLLGNASKNKEKNFLSENQSLAEIFLEWMNLADDIEELDNIVNVWKDVQPNLSGRIIRRSLLNEKFSEKKERYLQALILGGGSDAIFAATYSSCLKQ